MNAFERVETSTGWYEVWLGGPCITSTCGKRSAMWRAQRARDGIGFLSSGSRCYKPRSIEDVRLEALAFLAG